MAIYIDDGLITAENDDDIRTLLGQLQREFEIKVFEARVFLGLEIHQLADYSVHINHAEKVLVAVSTPIDSSSASEDAQDEVITYPFREAASCTWRSPPDRTLRQQCKPPSR